MTTLASLHARVKALRARIPFEEDPREFCLELAEGEDIPECSAAMIRPFDTVTIRRYPAGYLGLDPDDLGSIGYMSTLTGQVTVLYRDGRKERVQQHGRRTRGR